MTPQQTTEVKPIVRNGVDVTSLVEHIEAIQQNPVLAEFKFRNANKWIDGGLNRSMFTGFYGAAEERPHVKQMTFENDEPLVLLGQDSAPNPVEWILHAVVGCITTTTIYHAAARGIRIDEMSTKIEGDLDLRGILDIPGYDRPGYRKMVLDVTIKGDAPDDVLKELVEFARNHSPAVDVATNGSPLQLTVNSSK